MESGPPKRRPNAATSCVLGKLLGGPHIIIVTVPIIIYLSRGVMVQIKQDYQLKVLCTERTINVSHYN